MPARNFRLVSKRWLFLPIADMDSFFAAMKPYKRKKSTSSAAGSEEQTEAEPSPFEALLTHPFAVPDLGKKWPKMRYILKLCQTIHRSRFEFRIWKIFILRKTSLIWAKIWLKIYEPEISGKVPFRFTQNSW